jgi:hypothetical protein
LTILRNHPKPLIFSLNPFNSKFEIHGISTRQGMLAAYNNKPEITKYRLNSIDNQIPTGFFQLHFGHLFVVTLHVTKHIAKRLAFGK